MAGHTINDIMSRARTKLATSGWGQGPQRNRLGKIDVSQAIESAALELGVNPSQKLHWYRAFSAAIGTDRIVDWQDAPERTHAEVIAALARAGGQ